MALFSFISVLQYFIVLQPLNNSTLLTATAAARSLAAFVDSTSEFSARSKDSLTVLKASQTNSHRLFPTHDLLSLRQNLKQLKEQRLHTNSTLGRRPFFSSKTNQKMSGVSSTKGETATIDLAPSNQTENRIIYYLHIHKSAGSTMCIGAQTNGMKTSNKNCNVQRDQRCCGGGDGLESQRTFALSTKKNFVANEQDMYDAMDLEHYRYVVTLRNSRDRYLSHWKHVVRALYPNYTTDFATWWQNQPDNWNFRKICGTRCMSVPKYQITESLFQYTVDRLHNFEDILLFDRFNETFATFAQNVGWEKMPLTRGGMKKNVAYPDAGGAWDPLMSALDDALYEIGEARARGDAEAPLSAKTLDPVHRYFETGKDRFCDSPCCSSVCSAY
jgi:hypothetical protein